MRVCQRTPGVFLLFIVDKYPGRRVGGIRSFFLSAQDHSRIPESGSIISSIQGHLKSI